MVHSVCDSWVSLRGVTTFFVDGDFEVLKVMFVLTFVVYGDFHFQSWYHIWSKSCEASFILGDLLTGKYGK